MIGKIKSTFRGSVFYKVYKKGQSKIANLYFGEPSKGLIVIGVTGTDGKSSTCTILHKILNDNLGKTALFTTVEQKFGEETMENKYKMTNVSAWKTQKFLKQAIENDCKYCVLEVSSHGIDQMRVGNIDYDMAVLTNITEEHLDYHKTFNNYVNTKKELFQRVLKNKEGLGIAILNNDDNVGKQRSNEIAFKKTVTYGVNSASQIKGENIKEFIDHTEFNVKYLNEEYTVKTKLLGAFNVKNMLGAIAGAYALKIPFNKIIESINGIERVNGRLNPYKDERGVNYIIDYGHTPAGLQAVLNYLKEVKGNNKIITVFGAPGERDKTKRPKMGYIVSVNSDVMIITDDDPANEDRMQILEDVKKGVKRTYGDNYWVMPDRELAVKLAYDIASKGDIVLLAGKGHEKIQLTNTGKREYSDLGTLQNIIQENDGELTKI